jgi:uncharacterized protein (TIGR02271 family)
MGQQTVVGMFDSAEDASKAVSKLQNAGFSKDSYDIATRPSGGTTDAVGRAFEGDRSNTSNRDSNYNNASGTMVEGAADAAGRGVEKSGNAISRFFDDLFGNDNSESSRYSHVANRSSSIVTVHCDSTERAHSAAEILDECGAVDVDERAAQYGYGSTGNTTAARSNASEAQSVNASDTQSMKVIREDLNVGKREVETGGARLRSRIVERPVEENLRLREERVFVDREAVNRPATEADFQAFREGTIELRETAEVPVVNKEARVVEEVRLGKEAQERNETIRDTVRSTEVDVERIEGTDLNRDSNRNNSSSTSSLTDGRTDNMGR